MKNDVCCIFSQAAHYRASIYKLMDQQINCDFYITYWKNSPFKQMDYTELKNLKSTSKNIKVFSLFYWQNNILYTVFKPYKHYILIGNPYILTTWVVLVLAKLFGKKTYLWSHGWYGKETLLIKVIKKIFFSLSYKVLLYGDYARDLMIKNNISANKLITIYNSLDYQKQLSVREKLKSSDIYSNYFKNKHSVLLYIGRIQQRKKLHLLIEALYLLKVDGVECNLIIIGKDDENTGIHHLIDKYQLNEQIWMYGPCYNEDIIGELIFNSDLCVSPGNVGLTAMHSLAYGTPVITHGNLSKQMPEFEAILENVTGSFFTEDSVHDLSEKIKIWISKSGKSREVIRSKCYAIIEEKYNPQKQIEILKKLF